MFTPLFSLQAQIQGKAMSEAETKTEMTSIKASWGCWREVTYEGDKEMWSKARSYKDNKEF